MKPATAKVKGTETENIYVRFLRLCGIMNAERRRLNGAQDKGDISGWVRADGTKSVCVEVKSGAALKLPQWIEEIKVEKRNAGADLGFIAIRPKGKPDAKDWYAVMPMEDFIKLTTEAGYIG